MGDLDSCVALMSSVGVGVGLEASEGGAEGRGMSSSSMIQVLLGGSMVGRPMREWRTEEMWCSVKRRMLSKKSSAGGGRCGGDVGGEAGLSLLLLEAIFVCCGVG